MRNKIILLFILAAFAFAPLRAQSLKELFLRMSQEVCPALSEYNRLEIVDNQRNDKTMQTRNLLRTFSTMEVLTDDYARLVVSKSSEKQMRMLTCHDGTRIIMVVSTIFCDSVPDASVAFYSTEWHPLPATDYMDEPQSDDFRKISVDAESGRMDITLPESPLALTFEGGGSASRPRPSMSDMVRSYEWSQERNRYVEIKK